MGQHIETFKDMAKTLGIDAHAGIDNRTLWISSNRQLPDKLLTWGQQFAIVDHGLDVDLVKITVWEDGRKRYETHLKGKE